MTWTPWTKTSHDIRSPFRAKRLVWVVPPSCWKIHGPLRQQSPSMVTLQPAKLADKLVWWQFVLSQTKKKKMRRREIIHNGRSTPKPRMSFSRWIWFAFLGLLRSIIPDHNIVNIVNGRCRVPEDSNCFSWGTPSANTFDNCGSLVVLRTRLQHWDHYEVMTVY